MIFRVDTNVGTIFIEMNEITAVIVRDSPDPSYVAMNSGETITMPKEVAMKIGERWQG
jgi:hypothetical protein